MVAFTKINKIGGTIERGIREVLDKIRWPAAITLFLMALLTTADVIGRYIFSSPISGTNEIEELMMVVVVFLAMGYCTLEGRQSYASVVVSHLSERTRAMADSVTSFLAAVIFSLIFWQTAIWGWGEAMSPAGRATWLLLIPQGPFMLVAALGCLLVCFASLVNFFRSLARMIGR
jgi:TRAP-type C4-dicarboxylate transport system permease small subunit